MQTKGCFLKHADLCTFVPAYLSLGCFILVFLSRDMWPCHNLLSKSCQDLYLRAKAFKKKSLQLPSSFFIVRSSCAREQILCVVFIIHRQTNAAFVWMDMMDSLLRLCCDTARKQIKNWSDAIQGKIQFNTDSAMSCLLSG